MGNMLSSRVKGNLSRSVSDGRGAVVTLTSTLLVCQADTKRDSAVSLIKPILE